MNNIQDIATSDTTTHKILAAISIQRKISETIDDFSKTGIISFEQKAFIEKCEIARKEIEISVKKIKLLPAIDKDSPEFIEQSEIAYDSYSKCCRQKKKE